ncbi:hypothetical protein CPB83DRAFT_840616 [Crepidotus variabilis]|uniref:Uncharacterized protein n=1 Tax=Crepidotus variabilis TaxID=179855 RepID=A0A9P6E4D0_9AGAR|nr:hypothetical protein CPB83DRAFT_840616 [Crepidotus variabilis]
MANTYLATKWKRPFKILFILTNVMLGVFERQRGGDTWRYGPGKKLRQFDWPAVQYGDLRALIFWEATLRRGRVDADEQLLKNDRCGQLKVTTFGEVVLSSESSSQYSARWNGDLCKTVLVSLLSSACSRVGVLDPASVIESLRPACSIDRLTAKVVCQTKREATETPAPGKLQGSEPIQVTSEQKLGLKHTGEDISGQPMHGQEEIGQYNNTAEPDAEESKDVVITSADNASLVLYLVKYISKE